MSDAGVYADSWPRKLVGLAIYLALLSSVAATLSEAAPTPSEATQGRASVSPDADEAKSRLRSYQEKSRKDVGLAPQLDEKKAKEVALNATNEREELSKREGYYIRSGVFWYPAQIEELRWKRTRDIIERVSPGVDEDPVYLGIIARQAASIEMYLRHEYGDHPDLRKSALLDRTVIGTVYDPFPDAYNEPAGNSSLVVLSGGLIDFLYQAAKSVVLSWRPAKPDPGKKYALSPRPSDIEYVLSKNPFPEELLYKTLYVWLFEGRPRAVGYSPLPDVYVPALELLITFSERFVIAHEYTHALIDVPNTDNVLPPPPSGLSPDWQREYLADVSGFQITANSGMDIDQLPPNVALQGAFFALTAQDVIRRTLDLVRCGTVREDRGSESHPPWEQRIAVLNEVYQHQVPVGSKWRNMDIDLAVEGALAPSNTLNLLWGRIRDRFLEAHKKGMKVHPIWGEASCS